MRATDGAAYSDWAMGSFFVHLNEESVVMDLPAGWSMISLPVLPEGMHLSALFPDAVVVYKFKPGTGYVRVTPADSLEVGMGYWILHQ